MNHVLPLLKREYQEHRGVMLYLPVLEVLFVVLLAIGGVVLVKFTSTTISISVEESRGENGESVERVEVPLTSHVENQLRKLESMPLYEREEAVGNVANGVSAVVIIVLWFVVFFYLLGALYDDRRDRSVLFWKSMPVSDLKTVLAKLGNALVVIPLIFFTALVVAHVALATVGSIVAAPLVDVGSTIWGPANFFSRWVNTFASLFLNILWCMPLFTWVLFVSSWARSVPLIWVIAIPLGIAITDKLLVPGEYVSTWMATHATFIGGDDEGAGVAAMASRLASLDMLIAVVVSLALLYGAIWMRGRSGEI